MRIDGLLDLIFPSVCVRCRTYTDRHAAVCPSCLTEVKLLSSLFCGKCRARNPSAHRICHRAFPYLLGAATDYGNETVRELIHALKFQSIRSAAEPLGMLLQDYAKSLPLSLRAYTVLPIPLSARRERLRSYNQSLLVGEVLARALHLPLDAEALVRVKHTGPQSDLPDLDARRKNVQGAFAVRDANRIRGKPILLLDDVTTSGATLYEAATTLKASGARTILALTVAKA